MVSLPSRYVVIGSRYHYRNTFEVTWDVLPVVHLDLHIGVCGTVSGVSVVQ
jgi:hypothetical protein